MNTTYRWMIDLNWFIKKSIIARLFSLSLLIRDNYVFKAFCQPSILHEPTFETSYNHLKHPKQIISTKGNLSNSQLCNKFIETIRIL